MAVIVLCENVASWLLCCDEQLPAALDNSHASTGDVYQSRTSVMQLTIVEMRRMKVIGMQDAPVCYCIECLFVITPPRMLHFCFVLFV